MEKREISGNCCIMSFVFMTRSCLHATNHLFLIVPYHGFSFRSANQRKTPVHPAQIVSAAKKRAHLSSREPSGRIRRIPAKQKTEEMQAIVIAQPHRRAVGRHANDPRAGYALGRLWLMEVISKEQHDAGEGYTRAFLSYANVVAGPLPTFKGGLAGLITQGKSTAVEPEEEIIAAIKKRFSEYQSALLNGGDAYKAQRLLGRICLRDMDIEPEEVPALRCVLNSLCRVAVKSG